MTFEFQLSDREFRRAWLTEYFRRPGVGALRVLLGPAVVIVGIQLARTATITSSRVVAAVAIAFGAWHIVRPLAIVWMLVRRRRASGASDATMQVTIDALGVAVSDGKNETKLRWDAVTAAGRGHDYVWFEIRGSSRATIPLRAVSDEAALTEAFRSRSKWRST